MRLFYFLSSQAHRTWDPLQGKSKPDFMCHPELDSGSSHDSNWIPGQARNDNGLKYKINGFTLIEVILVIIIMGLIAVIGVPLIYEASQSQTMATNIANTTSQAEFALESMSREIRQIRSNKSSDLVLASSTDLIFYTASGKLTRYKYSNPTLTLTTSAGSGPLMSNLKSFSFEYFNASGAETSTVSDMRYIKINLTANIGIGGELPLQSIVYLRNT